MAIGTSVGSAFLDVVPQMGAGFQAQIGSKITDALGVLGPIGAVAGGVLAAGVAAGFAAFNFTLNIAETFDEAFDQIRVQTGATGDELAGLQEDFKAVFGSVPTDAATAADAIAGLAQRLNISGQPLQDLSAQILELSRLTETDLEGNIESVTRTFGDWGVAVGDQGATLDAMFRASQETGIGVDELGSSLVQFGAPLRALGFDFETSAALLAKFEEEGVNAELVMSGMKVALGKMAREGEPAAETLGRVMGEIADAGPGAEASRLAVELFGQKAGPDMAAAIHEGRFAVGDLIDTIASGEDTILGAGEDTQDLGEKWNIFKNDVLLALEPIATRVFTAIGSLIDVIAPQVELWINGTLIPAIDKFALWWDENGPTVIKWAGIIFGAIGAGIGMVVSAIGTVIGWFFAFIGAINTVRDAVDTAWNEVDRIFATVWGNITTFFSDTWDGIVTTVDDAIADVLQFFEDLPGDILGFLEDLPGDMIEFGKDLVGGILEGLANLGAEVYDSISGAIGSAIEKAKNFFGISSPSTVFRDQLGIPFGQGVVVGFEEGLQPSKMLAATSAALSNISGAALPSFGSSGTGSGSVGNLAVATPTAVTLYLDSDGKEKLAEFVVDWANRHIRQVSRAGG